MNGNKGAASLLEREEREDTRDMALEKIRSAGNLTLSPELFEKLYLQPKTAIKGDLRSTVGNPTPL
jgi:hypothetical protein